MDLYTLRNSVCLLTALCLCFTGRLDAQNTNLNNLDILEPIVRRSPADDTDFFGFATVLHQIQPLNNTDNVTTAAGKTRIIVGAPFGTFPGGLSLSNSGEMAENRTGLVYSCPVQPGICEGVRGDTSLYVGINPPTPVGDLPDSGARIEGRLFDQASNAVVVDPASSSRSQFEIKTGQLMGATLYSNGANFIACAPRWTATLFTGEDEQPRGVCYASRRDLNNFQYLQPCSGGPASTFNTDGLGYCMAGVSAAMVRNEYAIAAPGYDGLRGRVYYGVDNAAIRNGGGEDEQPNSDGTLDEINNQYQGFQTTTGYISQHRDSGQAPDHIATVPRYNGTTYKGRVNIVNPNQPGGITNSYLNITAEGQQMGEFFGYSIAAVDLNGDGFDELVIGAPMHTVYGSESIGIERGRVYFFSNTGGNLSQPGMFLEGQVDRGRFGNSVTNLGDIDDDGNEDIAVGAPGNRTVYIYYGRDDLEQFRTQTPFVISADQIVNNVEGLDELRTFGWSLSSGVDVDNNEYNDLLIGDYESKTVVLLRTLPVANVTVSFDPVPPVVIDPMSCSCFNLTVHATYTGRGLSGPIDISYNITENNVDSSTVRRLTFGRNRTSATRTLQFSSQQTASDTLTVYADSGITEFTSPFQLRVDLLNINRTSASNFDGNQPLTDLSSFPRVRNTGDSTTEVPLVNPCDPVCQSDVEIQVEGVQYINTAGGMSDSGVVAGRVASVNIILQYMNRGMQDAFGTTLSFNQQEAVFSQYLLRDNGARIRDCSQNGNIFTCALPRRLSPGANIRDVLELVVAENLGGNAPDAVFTFNLTVTSSSSNETNLMNNVVMRTLPVSGEADLFVTMADLTIQQSANAREPIQTLADLGLFRPLVVTVTNRGPTIVQDARLFINFPTQSTETGSNYFLYPGSLSINIRGSLQSQARADCSPVNPNNFPPAPAASNRRRRQIEMAPSLERVVRQVSSSLTCPVPDPNGGNEGTCFPINCNISQLEATGRVEVVIRSYVDDRFYASQIPRRTFVVMPAARVNIIDSFLPDTSPSNNMVQSTITIAEPPPPPTTAPPTNNPLLIHAIIWPIVGGVILVILLAVALYCFGFFRRKNKKTLEGTAEAEGDFDPNKFKVQQVGDMGVETVHPPDKGETTQL